MLAQQAGSQARCCSVWHESKGYPKQRAVSCIQWASSWSELPRLRDTGTQWGRRRGFNRHAPLYPSWDGKFKTNTASMNKLVADHGNKPITVKLGNNKRKKYFQINSLEIFNFLYTLRYGIWKGKINKKKCYLNDGKFAHYLNYVGKTCKVPDWFPVDKFDIDIAKSLIKYKKETLFRLFIKDT